MTFCRLSLGCSAAAARAQLLHSARVYLRPESYERSLFRPNPQPNPNPNPNPDPDPDPYPNPNPNPRYSALVPNVRWFQAQREALGNEAWLYSMVELSRAAECLQHGFDETSIDGVPTLNQWVLLDSGPELPPRLVTIQCAGLLVGSKATGTVYPNPKHNPKANSNHYLSFPPTSYSYMCAH
jgi:hypothetical protein